MSFIWFSLGARIVPRAEYGCQTHCREKWSIKSSAPINSRAITGIALIAAFTALITMLRVNRALADASIGERGDAAAHNALVRAEAARLITEGYAGLVTGHTHEPCAMT